MRGHNLFGQQRKGMVRIVHKVYDSDIKGRRSNVD